MARVLMCWEMGDGLAYIEGITPVGRLMRKAGHEIEYALRDLTHAERLLGGKFPFYQAPTQTIPHSTRVANPMNFADVLINLGYSDPGAIAGRVRAWRGLLEMVKPDIVRAIHAPGALLAARGTGMRSVAVGIGFLIPPPISPLPALRHWQNDPDPAATSAREQMVLEGMNQGLASIGAPSLRSVGALYAETDKRELYTYPELDDYGPREDVDYRGNFQAAAGAEPQWPELPGKRIFAYLEPFQQIDVVLKALAAAGKPVLAYMPRPPEALVKLYAGSNLRITDQPVDVVKAAALCDQGVSLGGHNIVGTFLAAGKPQLMIPMLFPERITAEKVVGLGAGAMSGLDPQTLAGSLAKLDALADAARAAAARLPHPGMQETMQKAVATIDQLAAAGPRK